MKYYIFIYELFGGKEMFFVIVMWDLYLELHLYGLVTIACVVCKIRSDFERLLQGEILKTSFEELAEIIRALKNVNWGCGRR